METIKYVSDQLKPFANEVVDIAKDISKRENISIENAIKILEITTKVQYNDIIWLKSKENLEK